MGSRPEIAVLVGLQGSGKSTFYRERLARTHRLVSKDRMKNRRDKPARQLVLLRQALAEGAPVAVDNTNASPAERAPLLALGRELGVPVVAYVFDVPLADCLERNARRAGAERIPVVGVYATARRYVRPTRAEGWDAIYRVVPQPGGGFEIGRVEGVETARE